MCHALHELGFVFLQLLRVGILLLSTEEVLTRAGKNRLPACESPLFWKLLNDVQSEGLFLALQCLLPEPEIQSLSLGQATISKYNHQVKESQWSHVLIPDTSCCVSLFPVTAVGRPSDRLGGLNLTSESSTRLMEEPLDSFIGFSLLKGYCI